MLVLADTGILFCLLDHTDPLHADVRMAVRVLRQRSDASVTSPQNAAEFWNVCSRPATARGGLGLDVDETNRRLRIIERSKMERRAKDYGNNKNPPDTTMTPEQWVAEEKLMPGALQGYRYVEDGTP